MGDNDERLDAARSAAGDRDGITRLDWPMCLNVRDLGGLPASDGRIRRRALIRADRLTRLTEVGVGAIRSAGVSRVVDLRTRAQCERDPSPFAGSALYRNVALKASSDLDRRPFALAERYRARLDLDAEGFAAAVEAVADAPAGAVVVHCGAGKDRTGLLVALLLSCVGVPDAVIAADYAESGTCLAEHYEVKRRSISDVDLLAQVIELHSARPDTMLTVLEHLRHRYGSVMGYVGSGGLQPQLVASLRARLVEPGG